MIAHETFRSYRWKDLLVILSGSGLFALLSFIQIRFAGPIISYGLSIFLAVLIMTLLVNLIKKPGTAFLFMGLGSLLSYNVGDIGVGTSVRLVTFILVAVVFELIFLIFKFTLINIQLDVIVAVSIAVSTLPILAAIMLSTTIAREMIIPLLNMVLLSFFIGLVASTISFIIWYYVRGNKVVIKFQV